MGHLTTEDHNRLAELKNRINTPGEFEQVIYVISHPRSGNTYTRYILENITRFKSYGYIGSGDLDSIDNAGVLRDVPDSFFDSSGIIRKRHGFYKEMYSQTSPQKVIFILRNPIDIKYRDQEIWNSTTPSSFNWKFYMKLVKQYLELSGFPKTMIRYEDLISNPKNSINSVIAFLDPNASADMIIRKQDFFDNLDFHIEKSRKRTPQSFKAQAMSWAEDFLAVDETPQEWRELESKVRREYPEALEALKFVEGLYT